MTGVFLASLRKECLLISRDWHALLVLFVMPSVFVLIMSLALQEKIHGDVATRLAGRVMVEENTAHARQFADILRQSEFIALSGDPVSNSGNDDGGLFQVRVLSGFSRAIDEVFDGGAVITIRFSPLLGERERQLVTAAVRDAFARVDVLATAAAMGEDATYADRALLKKGAIVTLSPGGMPAKPNATQQSVPAWLVFSMFFVSIPVSTTLIAERQQKTLLRLRTDGVPAWVIYATKLLPYLPVNVMQLLLVLFIGAVLVPMAGGEALMFAHVLPQLLVLTLALSVAVAGYGALIATLAHTVEQATVMTGTLNIVLGALGGIMVPAYVMPALMQSATRLSPMSWALNGYLDALVYHLPLSALWPVILSLIGLGGTLLAVAIVLFQLRAEPQL